MPRQDGPDDIARWRMARFRPPAADSNSISLNTGSIMPSKRSSLLATWLYSDIAPTPTAWARLRLNSVSMPFSSAKAPRSDLNLAAAAEALPAVLDATRDQQLTVLDGEAPLRPEQDGGLSGVNRLRTTGQTTNPTSTSSCPQRR